MTRTIAFTITGGDTLHCASCERRVERALNHLTGVQHVKASVDTQRVVVSLDTARISPGAVQAKLEELGYEARQEGAA